MTIYDKGLFLVIKPDSDQVPFGSIGSEGFTEMRRFNE
jgi:hypothetical protein